MDTNNQEWRSPEIKKFINDDENSGSYFYEVLHRNSRHSKLNYKLEHLQKLVAGKVFFLTFDNF